MPLIGINKKRCKLECASIKRKVLRLYRKNPLFYGQFFIIGIYHLFKKGVELGHFINRYKILF